MGIARKWVFPILRLVIFVAVAAALVKLAFFADVTEEERGGATPSGAVIDPQVAAAIATIRNDVKLEGTVNADAAIPIRATFAGEVKQVLVSRGQAVAAGTQIAVVRSESVNTEGVTVVKTQKIAAGADGVLSAFTLLPGQAISVGDTVGQVAPTSFNVSAPVSPEQQYRLLQQPTEAQVTVTGGPAPFTCTGLTITAPLAGSGSSSNDGDGAAGDGGSASTATVTCHVPAAVRVFAGLAASVLIAGGVAENALTVPMTAVQGAAGSGLVYVVGDTGDTKERPVTLGINDGTNVQIVDGLKEGELILEFVPGAAAADPNAPGAASGGAIVTDVAP